MDETENVSEDSVKKNIWYGALYKNYFFEYSTTNSSVLSTFIFISGIAANYLYYFDNVNEKRCRTPHPY